MLHSQTHGSGLVFAALTQMKLAQEAPSEIPTVQISQNDLSPIIGKFISQGGSILAFLIVLCFLTQAITSLVKAIKS
jgi:hypothetical protein